MNIYNSASSIIDDNSVYEAFNSFIFSKDRKVLHKLFTRQCLFHQVKDLSGDIVECGVFKGSGIFTWAKLIELYCHFEIKKVIGFDFFDQTFIADLAEQDRESMEQVFSRCDATPAQISKTTISENLLSIGIPSHKFELIKGDISLTSLKYTTDNPGFRISLLYMDLDLEKPTLDALENFWNFIVPGGVIVFDEYGYGAWTESNAVDIFVKKHNLVLRKTNVSAPTAYVVKM
jgi:hypothetical protein